MQFKGSNIPKPSPRICKIFRGKDVLEFVCHPVVDFTEFNRLVPEPKLKVETNIETGAKKPVDVDGYKKATQRRGQLRSHWIVFQSLTMSGDLVFESVVADDPETWANLYDELEKSNLTIQEVNRLVDTAFTASDPDGKGDDAVDVFSQPADTPEMPDESI